MPERELARLLDATGPFVSVYLATDRGVEDAAYALSMVP